MILEGLGDAGVVAREPVTDCGPRTSLSRARSGTAR